MKEKMLLDAKEVAQMLGVSLRKLEYLISDGNAPAFKHIGRTRKWRINDIDEWIEKLYQESSN
ncbi:MAG: helix-turn-helix domain-containing protein [Methylophilus sp.]